MGFITHKNFLTTNYFQTTVVGIDIATKFCTSKHTLK